MLRRWVTQRCCVEDVPRLTQSRGAIRQFLEAQQATPTRQEPFRGATRADTFTHHHAQGRGAQWLDREHDVLWLLCLRDGHEAGYEWGHELARRERLYPRLDPSYDATSGFAQAPWGSCPDEDELEWRNVAYAALTTFEQEASGLADGELVRVEGTSCPLRAQLGEDGVMSVTISRRFAYPTRSPREAWLTDGQLRELFAQLAPDVAEEDQHFHAPPYSPFAVNVDFLGEFATPDRWISGRAEELLSKRKKGYGVR